MYGGRHLLVQRHALQQHAGQPLPQRVVAQRAEATSEATFITSDCPGVPDADEGVYDLSNGYVRIDALEVAAGAAQGRPRVKRTDWASLLDAAQG